MAKKDAAEPSISQHIIDVVRDEKPETVNQLVKLVQQKYGLDEPEIVKTVIQLQNEGKIRSIDVKESARPKTLREHLSSSKALWYWLTLALAAATAIAAFTIPEDAYPTVYARYILGAIFILWLPGYALIKALFPTQLPIKTSSEDLDVLERVVLSICMSIALVPITGLLLNYTPWGIRLTPIIVSLLALTTIFATAAVIREHNQYASAHNRSEK